MLLGLHCGANHQASSSRETNKGCTRSAVRVDALIHGQQNDIQRMQLHVLLMFKSRFCCKGACSNRLCVFALNSTSFKLCGI